MDKKLIAEDIQRMRFMFGYEPGKVISEQQDINELGGMEDGHPKFGKMNFSKMSDEEIENVLDDILASDDEEGIEDDDYDLENDEDFEEEDDFEEDDEVIYEIEVEEGFDSPEIKSARGGKDFTTKEFSPILPGSKFNIDKDDSITTKKYIDNQIDDFLDDDDNDDFLDDDVDDVDLSWLDESWDEE